MSEDLRAARRAWLFVAGTITESFLVYGVVGWFLARARPATGRGLQPPLLWGLAAALCVLGAAAGRRSASSPDRATFQGRSLLALALLEANALLGLVAAVVEHRVEPAVTLPALSVAASLLFVLPAGLAFFRPPSAIGPT